MNGRIAPEDNNNQQKLTMLEALDLILANSRKIIAKKLADLHQNARDNLLQFIKNEFLLCRQTLPKEFNGERFISDLQELFTTYAQAPNKTLWQALSKTLELQNTNDLVLQEKGLKLFLAIRHQSILWFPDEPLLRDPLDSLLADLNAKKTITPEDYQTIHTELISQLYVFNNAVSLEVLQGLDPALQVLMENKLLNKANFIRLLLSRHFSNQHLQRDNFIYSLLYEKTENTFYIAPVAEYDNIVSVIIQLKEASIFNRRNFEILMRFYENNNMLRSYRPDIDSRVEELAGLLSVNSIDGDQEQLYGYIEEIDNFTYKLDDTGELLIRIAEGTELQDTRDKAVKKTLEKVLAVYRPATIMNFMEETAPNPIDDVFKQALDHAIAEFKLDTQTTVIQAIKNVDELSGLLLILHDFRIATPENFALLMAQSASLNSILEVFIIILECRAFMPVAKAFDVLMLAVNHIEAIKQALQDLPADSRTTHDCEAVVNTVVRKNIHALAVENITLNKLIGACITDYSRSGFFCKSHFLKDLSGMSMSRALAFAQDKPTSRTAKSYVHLYVNNLPDGEYKDFWNRYLRSYKFSVFQKSALVKKLLKGEIRSMEDVEAHAERVGYFPNRTASQLNSMRRKRH